MSYKTTSELDNVSGEVNRVLIAYEEHKWMIGHEGLGIQRQRHGHPSSI